MQKLKKLKNPNDFILPRQNTRQITYRETGTERVDMLPYPDMTQLLKPKKTTS